MLKKHQQPSATRPDAHLEGRQSIVESGAASQLRRHCMSYDEWMIQRELISRQRPCNQTQRDIEKKEYHTDHTQQPRLRAPPQLGLLPSKGRDKHKHSSSEESKMSLESGQWAHLSFNDRHAASDIPITNTRGESEHRSRDRNRLQQYASP